MSTFYLQFKKKYFFFFIAFIFMAGSQSLWAQKETITGTVTTDDGEVLPGVSIVAKEVKSMGTVTDFDGIFQLKVPNKVKTLVISYVGFATQEVAITDKKIINVVLKVDSNELEEVVVIGYGTQRRADVTGAIASVKAEELDRTVNMNIADALQGKVAGVKVSTEDGTPGGAFKINIRGAAAITGSTQPLYVVDGFPIEVFDDNSDEGSPYDGASGDSPLDFLDPSMIESVEILKDASATAIYGSRGGNGVVIITTKQGKPGDIKVSYRWSSSISKVADDRVVNTFDNGEFADFMINREYFNLANWDFDEETQSWDTEVDRDDYLLTHPFPADPEVPEFITRDEFAKLPSTDWMREILQVGIVSNHVVSVSGGTPENLFDITGSYLKNESVVVGSGFDRYVLNVKLKHKIGTKLTAQTQFTPSFTKQYGAGSAGGGNSGANNQSGVFTRTLKTPPFLVPGDIDTSIGDDGDEEITYNDPVYQLENEIINNKNLSFRGSTKLSYKFTNSLSANVSLALTYGTKERRAYYPPTFGTGNRPNYNGLARRVDTKSTNFNNDNTLVYNKKVGNHRFNALIGFTQNSRKSDTFNQTARGFEEEVEDGSIDYDLASSYDKIKIRTQEIKQLGYLARLSYVFDNKYSFTGTIRRDGDSRFATSENPYRNFPSAAFAWTASKERFMDNADFVDNLKLRISYGLGGNSGVKPQDSRESFTQFAYSFGGTPYIGFGNRLLVDKELTWQSTSQYDFGVDMSMFRNRLSLVYDVYYKQTTDMILDRAVGHNIGYDYIRTNAGDIDNWGHELTLNSTNMQTKKFKWTSSLTIAADRSEILSLGGPDIETISVRGINGQPAALIVGENIGTWIGYEADGVYNSWDEINNSSMDPAYLAGLEPGDMKYIDQDGDGFITDTDGSAVIGRTQAKFHGGFWNNFEIGNFELGMFFTFKHDFDVINGDRYAYSYLDTDSNNQVNTALYNAWTPENPGRNHPSYNDNYMHDVKAGPNYFSSYHIEDGSFIRLQNISFTYNFPKKILSQSFINNMSLSFNVTNAYLWTNYSGSDPENSVARGRLGALSPNLDFASFPRARNWNTTLNIGF